MAVTLIGRKVGMTRMFTPDGRNVPVTVLQVGPCYVSQIKADETDGYSSLQLAFEDVKPRRSTMPVIGHDAKAGLGPKRVHRECRIDAAQAGEYALGQSLTVALFENVKYVDVTGVSKGKGFQGPMKRHGFKGQLASHGVERKHRSPGSIASHAANAGESGTIRKGKKMAGHMGSDRVTARNLDVLGVDKDRNLLLVKGPVPGSKQGLVTVQEAKRLWKRKARALAEAS